jgi:hypothetical protein
MQRRRQESRKYTVEPTAGVRGERHDHPPAASISRKFVRGG